MLRRKFLQTSLAIPIALKKPVKVTGMTETIEVINAGVGGNNTIDLLNRIEKDCMAHHPDLTILMIGTNDMNSRKYIPLAEYETNLRKIIGIIKQSGSRILLMTILPVYEPYLFKRHNPDFYQPEGHFQRKTKVNELIRKLALEYDLQFLDIHQVFQKIGNVGLSPDSLIKNEANSQSTDGVHPTAQGYKVIATAVYAYLSDKFKSGKIVCFGDSITIGDGKADGENYPAYLKKMLNN